jgi:hypothetical protein
MLGYADLDQVKSYNIMEMSKQISKKNKLAALEAGIRESTI